MLGIYEHFKGGNYEVIGVARHTETGEEFVIYKSVISGTLWARPRKMFEETVEHEGDIVPRYRFLPHGAPDLSRRS